MPKTKILQTFLRQYQDKEAVKEIASQLSGISNPVNNQKLIEIYNRAIPVIEEFMWQDDFNTETIENYQQLFHELENNIESVNIADSRHKFIIAIPVADRPRHLKTCLQSILTLCDNYKYGGLHNGLYNKINVLISDDSKEQENIIKNIEIAQYFTAQGLKTIYFGEKEQKEITEGIDINKAGNIIGNIHPDKYYHKGASITRNITYLKLQQLKSLNEKTLFYFIDSDQEFQICIQAANEHKLCYGINYFYYLDRIFSDSDVSILTGKVVGDPPVSPAVMAGRFLQDLIYFTERISKLNPSQACSFHNDLYNYADDASYHDMAELFGFKHKAGAHNYVCPLKNEHRNIDCFNHFASSINHFFDGEHPTRKTYYQHENVITGIKPARTIYTGNYIFKHENLKYFIPFAKLKLRMAGPVLGRIIKAELGSRFVSANLPMLHNRTLSSSGQSEFRAGVSHKQKLIDLSGEFSRQFFGDVMLFSMNELTDMGYPGKYISFDILSNIIHKTIKSMTDIYSRKQIEISAKTSTLKTHLNNTEFWWNNNPELSQARQNFAHFIDNIEYNFGKNALIYKIINSEETLNLYHKKIADAITAYSNDSVLWQDILAKRTAQI